MTQLFSKSADTALRVLLIGGTIGTVVVFGAIFTMVRSADFTSQNVTIEQTVPFSHHHHVNDIGIDCRYCHQSVETSAVAGVPPTQVCMNCHRELWKQSDMLAPVRASWKDNQPLVWNRVHDLPDYVYFNHSIHLHKGIGCYECHGRIDEMPLTRQAAPLTMQWCLECHRDPEQHVRPRSLVFKPKPLEELTQTDEFLAALLRSGTRQVSTNADEAKGILAKSTTGNDDIDDDIIAKLRRQLSADYHLDKRTDCTTCHR
ncbi:MAG TPA: cytochrome c3 family protein [Planctomycetaceae bacterium]|nr:cytochrome c3 family protein [Planctomycetaceae bacterium]